MIKKITLIIFVLVLFMSTTTAYAQSADLEWTGTQFFSAGDNESKNLEYAGNICVSAYYPNEDSFTHNFEGQPLEDLIGDIVACPTGSDLLGKTIMIVSGDQCLIRKVWDTGCAKGRIDLLVGNSRDMNNWGLRNCDIWVVN